MCYSIKWVIIRDSFHLNHSWDRLTLVWFTIFLENVGNYTLKLKFVLGILFYSMCEKDTFNEFQGILSILYDHRPAPACRLREMRMGGGREEDHVDGGGGGVEAPPRITPLTFCPSSMSAATVSGEVNSTNPVCDWLAYFYPIEAIYYILRYI